MSEERENMSSGERRCPSCGKTISTLRVVCPMCGDRIYKSLVEREREDQGNARDTSSREEIHREERRKSIKKKRCGEPIGGNKGKSLQDF